MKTELRNKTRRLCGMFLAIVLTLASVLPAFAENTKPAVDPYGLQVRDILMPGDRLTYPSWLSDGIDIMYFDYNPSGYFYPDEPDLGGYSFTKASSEFAIKDYSLGENDPDNIWDDDYLAESLKLEDFGGWEVVSKVIDTAGSSGLIESIYLMAVPKNRVMNANCTTKVAAYDNEDYSEDDKIPVPAGAGVQLFAFDQRTGEPILPDAKGALTVAPGDLVYVVSAPVEGFYSRIDVTTEKETSDGTYPCSLYYEGAESLAYWYFSEKDEALRKSVQDQLEDATFLPAEFDAVTLFVMPHSDVQITADYIESDETYEVRYYERDSEDALLKETGLPINKKITIWDPSDGKVRGVNGNDILFWWEEVTGYWGSLEIESYYLKNETIRVVNDYTFLAKKKSADGYSIKIAEGSPLKAFYSTERGFSAPRVEAEGASYIGPFNDPAESVSFLINPGEVQSGKNISEYKIGMELSDQILGDEGDEDDEDGFSEYFFSNSAAIYGNATVDVKYGKNKPLDKLVDLSRQRYQVLAGEEDQEAYMSRYFFEYIKRAYDPSLSRSVFFTHKYALMHYYTANGVLLDLNKDTKWDVLVSIDDGYDLAVQFEKLYGAADCEKPYYDILLNQSDFGKVRIKLYDGCNVEYFSDGKSIYTQDVIKGKALKEAAKEASVAKEGYLLKGWSTAADGSKVYDFTSPVTEDLKLYAIWEKNEPKKEDKKDKQEEDDDLTKPHDTDSEADIKGAKFGHLFARVHKSTKDSITLKWKKVPGAAGYIIFGSLCNSKGKKYSYQYLKTLDANKTTWTQKDLAKDKYYKYYVLAFKEVNGKRDKICISKSIHATTVSPKFGAAQKITVNKKKVKLQVGKKFKIKAKEINTSKTIQHHRGIGFESSDESVAKVDKNGKIKAVGTGTCKIWVFAQNGKYTEVKVEVTKKEQKGKKTKKKKKKK